MNPGLPVYKAYSLKTVFPKLCPEELQGLLKCGQGQERVPWLKQFGNYFLKNVFFMWTILKVFIEFAATLLLLYALVSCGEACGIPVPRPGTKPTPPKLEGEVPTTGSQVRSQFGNFCLHTLPIRVSTFVIS